MEQRRYGIGRVARTSLIILAGSALLAGCLRESPEEPQQVAGYSTTPEAGPLPSPSETILPVKSLEDWVQEYGAMPLADAHNHGSVLGITDKLQLWEKDSVDRVVLFGEVSRGIAVQHDLYTWQSYTAHPGLIVPFFSGIDLMDPQSLDTARSLLEKGYFGIGEIAAASTYSPAVADAEWKADDPMAGILPQLYELCAEYKAPLLLHIDPPSGYPVMVLEEALKAYPETIFIFGHANAYNLPYSIESLLESHKNIYMDIFAGFTAFNRESTNKLEDFVSVIRKYPDRFMLSTDSGYAMPRGEEQAVEAMYMLLDLLKDDPELVRKIAYDNLDALLRIQPATKAQKDKLQRLNQDTGSSYDVNALTKLEAGRILAEAKVQM